MTLIQLINLWLIGIREQNIPPLATLNPALVKHFDNGARKLSKIKRVIEFVELFALERGVWIDDLM